MTPIQLRAWRKKKKLTQQEAADELVISLPQYQKWEQGSSPIRGCAEKYIKLMQAFDELKDKIAKATE